MKLPTHKGYDAIVGVDAADRIFGGHVAGIRDILGFQGETMPGLEAAFDEALDDYLAACEALGQSPDLPR